MASENKKPGNIEKEPEQTLEPEQPLELEQCTNTELAQPLEQKQPLELRECTDMDTELAQCLEPIHPLEAEQFSSEIEKALLSIETLDRSSPEMWPETYADMVDFFNNLTSPTTANVPYSRELNQADQAYLQKLGKLPISKLVAKVKDLHDAAYQLGVEEAKEITRAKHLMLFKSRKQDE